MQIFLSDDALAVEATMNTRDYNKLWDVLEFIAADPEAARTEPRNRFISSRKEWGTHIPGTRYTAFWFTDDAIRVTLIADENLTEH